MVNFLSVFISYLLLMLIIVIAGGAAIAIGIRMRKKKNLESAAENTGEPPAV